MDPRPSPARERLQTLAAWGVLPAFLALVLALDGGLVDDAYIFCRYAGNLLDGHGLVFNPGERVEGFTSPLHVVLIALAGVSGGDLPGLALGISVLAGAAALFLLWRRGPHGPFAAVLAAAALPFPLWSATGMDASLFALSVLVALRMAGTADRVGGNGLPSRWTWLALGALVWVRPEGAVLALAVAFRFAARIWTRRRELRTWLDPLWAFAPVVVLTLARIGYFGDWLPNTFRAKVDGGGLDLRLRGLGYLADAAIDLAPLLVAAAAGLWLSRRNAATRLPVAFALALMVVVVAEGGDYFAMYRFAVPVIPLVADLAGRGIVRIPGPWWARAGATAILGAAVGLWSAWAPAPFDPRPEPQMWRYREETALCRLWDSVGQELRQGLGPVHRVALVNVGAIPFRTGWETVDMAGLTDRHVAASGQAPGTGTAAHERFDTDYVLGRAPDVVLLSPFVLPGPVPEDTIRARLWGVANRDLARSARFREEYRLQWLPVERGVVPIHVRAGATGDRPERARSR